jgi:hypothetical protein
MLRRVSTLVLVLAIALGGMVSAACASAHCAQMTRARMRCCPTEGLRAARSCCGNSIAPAAPASAATLERAPLAPPLAALPALLTPVASPLAARAIAPVRLGGTGPPTSLIRLHTSLLL